MPVPPDVVSDAFDAPFPFASDDPSITGPATSSPDEAPPSPAAPSPRSGTTADGESAPEAPEFSPRHREALTGLLYLGDLTDEFTWGGHKFRIRTLHPDELKAVAVLHSQYSDTIGDVRAYADALVAACVTHVDGRPLPIEPLGPLENDTLSRIRARSEYVSSSWYSWTIDAIYERYRALEGRVEELLAALGN